MTHRQIALSIQTRKIKLTSAETWTHFGPVLALLFIGMMPLVTSAYSLITDLSQPPALTWKAGLSFFAFIVLGKLAHKMQSGRLKLSEVQISITQARLLPLIESYVCKKGWRIVHRSEGHIVASSHPSMLSGSWGERITMIFVPGQVLLNSICDPDKPMSLVSMRRNRRNVAELAQYLRDTTALNCQPQNIPELLDDAEL